MKRIQVLFASCLILTTFTGMAQDVSLSDEFNVSASTSQIRITKRNLGSIRLTIAHAKLDLVVMYLQVDNLLTEKNENRQFL